MNKWSYKFDLTAALTGAAVLFINIFILNIVQHEIKNINYQIIFLPLLGVSIMSASTILLAKNDVHFFKWIDNISNLRNLYVYGPSLLLTASVGVGVYTDRISTILWVFVFQGVAIGSALGEYLASMRQR